MQAKEILMINSLQFWTLIAGLAAFVASFFFPNFPFDEAQILAAVLFVLGLIGVTPQVLGPKAMRVTFGDLLKSKAFWTLIAGVAAFILHYYAPDFPMDQAAILALIVFVLNAVGINPELRHRGLM